jgi:hypothetical protein
MVWINKSKDVYENKEFSKWLQSRKGDWVVYVKNRRDKWKILMVADLGVGALQFLDNKSVSLDDFSDPICYLEKLHMLYDLKFADYETEFEPYYEY